MEAAQKSGDQNAQAAAALEGLGTLLGGGKRVDPVDIDQLKPFVPDTLRRPAEDGEQCREERLRRHHGVEGRGALTAAGDKQVTLEISDTGGVSGLMAHRRLGTG